MKITRRRLLLSAAAIPALQGCAAPLQQMSSTLTAANSAALLKASAAAHGYDAFWSMSDVN